MEGAVYASCAPRDEMDTVKSRPLLTIGVPTFNRGEILARRLEELRGHIGRRVSLLVVDNCSGDSTRSVVEEAARECSGIQYIRNGANIGCDGNYLRVIENAQGEWCWLLGDDDPIDVRLVNDLMARLESESADAVHLVAPGVAWRSEWGTLFRNSEEIARRFYSLSALQSLSSVVLRVSAARQHLIEGYRVAGHFHAYTGVVMATLEDGNGLRVYDLPLLRLGKGKEPRWNRMAGELGAWATMRELVPARLRPVVDRREARDRVPRLTRAAVEDLVGVGPRVIDPGGIRRVAYMFPIRWYPFLLAILLARLSWRVPRLAALGWAAATMVMWGPGGLRRLRAELLIPVSQGIVGYLEDGIRKRRIVQSEVAQSEY